MALGEERLGDESSPLFRLVAVSGITLHPSADLALWRLATPVDTTLYGRVCLPAQDTEYGGSARLLGWRVSPLVGKPLWSAHYPLLCLLTWQAPWPPA